MVLTRYDKGKNRIYLLEDFNSNNLYDIGEEIRFHLEKFIPDNIALDLFFKKNSSCPLGIKIEQNSQIINTISYREKKILLHEANITSTVVRFTPKGHYLNVTRILRIVNELDKKLTPVIQKKEAIFQRDDTIRIAIAQLKKQLSLRPQDKLFGSPEYSMPYTLQLHLETPEEVVQVYRLVRDICGF